MIRHRLQLETHGTSSAVIQKCVLHTFLDEPGRSDVTHYLEICSTEILNFDITAPVSSTFEDLAQFYRDYRASDAMYGDYKMLDSSSGRHLQTVGDLRLRVNPCTAHFVTVAASGGSAEVCFNTNMTSLVEESVPVATSESEDEKSYGVWMKVVTPGALPWNAAARNHLTLEFLSAGCEIRNFYWFTYIPLKFEPKDEYLHVEKEPEKMQGREIESQSVMQFELSPDFPVYSPWAKSIYSCSILKNRRSLEFPSRAVARLSFVAVDEAFSARVSTLSFFLGVVLGIVGNAFVATVFLGFSERFTVGIVAAIASLAVVLAGVTFAGLRNVTK